ncbi:hypothetical protein PS682_00591 [Pseudomonas fluorescens]|jgi:hypothetical protein|uniref:Uncharacterized protein n=1 Tax=Pseudomonas fluorescens TaxID=294 RepID=A0A5E6RLY3_PSEFL|nr:hypothetical protein PS683_01730 [Pseudomonas fluorescens]VVM46667.1 hypothetical protein PS682_00591 [Pseudomonas fluorescens]VVM69429.1 hypothetical protein PS683_01730 [Pseudomonas fluorescens]VVN20192.1 hypothetical protein PS663_04309 [Pseudomonas fluorescens]VVQ01653.1 hypothetical protein PS907_05396 [Pseudomonas fluorescens]
MNTLSEPPSRLSPRQPLSLFPLKHPVFRLLTLSRSLTVHRRVRYSEICKETL